jgi:hypothetical protein
MSVPINRKAWSESSQKSSGGHYDDHAGYYEGIACRCFHCSISYVFTPEEQKLAYEIEKKYVWWLPTLCAICARDVAELINQDRENQKRWGDEKDSLSANANFLESWLDIINRIPEYGKKANTDMATMLRRRLSDI